MLSAFTIAKSATGDAADWKFAKTLYFGAAASQGSSPSATADKRCGNYDTCVSGGNAATVNSKIYDAFVAGPSEDGGAATIADGITTTYIQATLRYLNKMDKDVASGSATASSKNQGEGRSGSAAWLWLAFWTGVFMPATILWTNGFRSSS